jgi:hypothetical protein
VQAVLGPQQLGGVPRERDDARERKKKKIYSERS